MGTSKNALFSRFLRQLRTRVLIYPRKLRLCVRCFLELRKKLLFLEMPLYEII